MENLKKTLENSKTTNDILSINDKTDPLEIVTEINNYFAKSGSNLADQVPDSNLDLNFENKIDIPLLTLNIQLQKKS